MRMVRRYSRSSTRWHFHGSKSFTAQGKFVTSISEFMRAYWLNSAKITSERYLITCEIKTAEVAALLRWGVTTNTSPAFSLDHKYCPFQVEARRHFWKLERDGDHVQDMLDDVMLYTYVDKDNFKQDQVQHYISRSFHSVNPLNCHFSNHRPRLCLSLGLKSLTWALRFAHWVAWTKEQLARRAFQTSCSGMFVAWFTSQWINWLLYI